MPRRRPASAACERIKTAGSAPSTQSADVGSKFRGCGRPPHTWRRTVIAASIAARASQAHTRAHHTLPHQRGTKTTPTPHGAKQGVAGPPSIPLPSKAFCRAFWRVLHCCIALHLCPRQRKPPLRQTRHRAAQATHTSNRCTVGCSPVPEAPPAPTQGAHAGTQTSTTAVQGHDGSKEHTAAALHMGTRRQKKSLPGSAWPHAAMAPSSHHHPNRGGWCLLFPPGD